MHDHALFLILALLLNASFGGPRALYVGLGASALARLPASVLRSLERKLNREHRSEKEREIRGMVLVAAVVVFSVFAGWSLAHLLMHNLSFGELLIVTLCLPVRQAIDIAGGVRKALMGGSLPMARQNFEGTPWRHHAMLDEAGLCRASIEFLVIQFSLKIVCPLFWYLLFGLSGLFMSKLIYTLHEVATGSVSAQGNFGKAAEGFHQLIHIIPAHIAALLWLVAAPFIGGGRWGVAAAQLRAHTNSAPELLSLATAASVLGVTLGGPGSVYLRGKWVGTGTQRPGAADILQALYLFALLCLLLLVCLGALI